MARPVRLTDEIAGALVIATREHGTRHKAARAAGIGLRTLQRWIARGRAGEEPFANLVAALEAAERRRGSARYLAWFGSRILRGRARRGW